MESGSVTFNLPLKPYLKKFLIKKYGTNYTVSTNSWLGKYIIELMDKEYRRGNVKFDKKNCYQLVIPASVVSRIGFDISPTKIRMLESMIQKVFNSELYSYIDVTLGSNLFFYNEEHNSYNKQKINRAILQFLKVHEIFENEIEPESIYRDYSRYRESDNNKAVKNDDAA